MRKQFNEAKPMYPAQPMPTIAQPAAQSTRSTFSSNTAVAPLAFFLFVVSLVAAGLHYGAEWSMGSSIVSAAVMYLLLAIPYVMLNSGIFHEKMIQETRREEIAAQYPAAEHDAMHRAQIEDHEERLQDIEAKVMQKPIVVRNKDGERMVSRWGEEDQEIKNWLRNRLLSDPRSIHPNGQIAIAYKSALSDKARGKLERRGLVEKVDNNYFWRCSRSPSEIGAALGWRGGRG